MPTYRIGNYNCPTKRMSSDCIYVGPTKRTSIGRPPNGKLNKKSLDAVKLPFTGETGRDAGHNHKYVIHKNRSVTVYDAIHPDAPGVRHGHKYVGKWPNGYITRDKSSCYPNCQKILE